ncbi:hypothetical protein KY326_03800, partial [Candidatus Woesearchaeota archaeon]|nr:hypothetical protein [Candidatus Woesearchaeota archaeon]
MTNYVGADYYSPMEKEKWPDVGSTVHEQAEGRFTTSVAAKARMGVVDLDLQLGASDQRGLTGTGSYGKEARAELKKLAELQGLNISSVHAPIMQGGINNLSGFDHKQNFNENLRQQSNEEMRKVIDFAGDIATDKKPMAITVHAGEFPRDIMETGAREFEEPGKAKVVSVTNFESGKIISLPSDHPLNIVKMQEREGQEGVPIEERERVPVIQRNMTVEKFKRELDELNQEFRGNKTEIIRELNRRYGAGEGGERLNIFEENETGQHIKPEVVFLRAHFAAEARSAFADFKRWQAEADRMEHQLERERQEYGEDLDEDRRTRLAELEAEARWRRDTAVNSQRKWMDSKQSITRFVPTKEEGLKRSGDSLGVS